VVLPAAGRGGDWRGKGAEPVIAGLGSVDSRMPIPVDIDHLICARDMTLMDAV